MKHDNYKERKAEVNLILQKFAGKKLEPVLLKWLQTISCEDHFIEGFEGCHTRLAMAGEIACVYWQYKGGH